MIWTETYLIYCSVRLGVVVVGFLSFLSLFIPAILFFVLGIHLLDPLVELFEHDDYYKKNFFVVRVLNWMQQTPDDCMIALHFYLFLHMFASILAIYGAIKLRKWFLPPFILLELVRVVYSLSFHIVLMIVLKKIINLGVLIALTLAGGFLILYLGYNWVSTISLFQMINLIHTQRYQVLYGDDILHPHVPTYGTGTDYSGNVENVRVLITPNPNEIDELKQKYTNYSKTPPKTIISVMPANYDQKRLPNLSKRQSEWKRKERQKLEAKHVEKEEPSNNYYNDLDGDYGNWQWTELLGGAKKQNPLIGADWKRY